MSTTHRTDMSAESELSPAAWNAKYGSFRQNILTAYRARHPLHALDAAVSRIEDAVGGAALDQPLDRPVFVLGNFRSGTTFLEQVLGTHPAFGHFTFATSAFPRSPRFGDAMRRTIPGFMNAMVPPHQPNMQVDGASPFEAESLWSFCRNNVWSDAASNVLDADFEDPWFERFYRRTIQKQLRLQKKSRFLHKNPPNTVRLGFLARLFPDARFVYIVRHPLRMLRSQLDMVEVYRRMFPESDRRDYGAAFANLYLPPARVFPRTARRDEIDRAFAKDAALGVALSLVDVDDSIDRMRRRDGIADRVLTLRYEDLVAGYDTEMRRVLDFLGLDDELGRSAVLAQATKVDGGLVSRRSPLPTFGADVHAVLSPLASRFDYELAGS